MKPATILDATYHDGTVRVVKTCCGFEHPSLFLDPSYAGRHVGDHGWRPYWMSIDCGEWLRAGRWSQHAVERDWPVFAACARSLAEFLAACGIESGGGDA